MFDRNTFYKSKKLRHGRKTDCNFLLATFFDAEILAGNMARVSTSIDIIAHRYWKRISSESSDGAG